MKNNDRGFTLVELIISCAILGIIAVAAMGFLATGTRTYSYVNYSVRLQYESQLAMNQIENYVMDCSKGIAFDDAEKTLYIVNHNAAGNDTVYVYTLDSGSGEIRFGTGDAADTAVEAAETDVLTKNVEDMTVTFNRGADAAHASSATITLEFKLGNRQYTGSQTIALRNQPVYANDWSTLFGLVK